MNTDQEKTTKNQEPRNASVAELNALLSQALRALCLTRDYVGAGLLPAIDGWEWYDAGKKLADHLQDEWTKEFQMRANRYDSTAVRGVFNMGDWVVGTGEHKGCSQVFEGEFCDYQPFSRLNDFNPLHFRLATSAEITAAKSGTLLRVPPIDKLTRGD